jgi:hypothetical protein
VQWGWPTTRPPKTIIIILILLLLIIIIIIIIIIISESGKDFGCMTARSAPQKSYPV